MLVLSLPVCIAYSADLYAPFSYPGHAFCSGTYDPFSFLQDVKTLWPTLTRGSSVYAFFRAN